MEARVSFRSWEFFFQQVPWLCESLSSVTPTPKMYYFAADTDLFNMMRTMKEPDCSTANAETAGGSIGNTLIYSASKLTTLLKLSRFQQSVPLSTANVLANDAIQVLESFTDTWPRQNAGISKPDLIKDLQTRMRLMNNLFSEMATSDRVFLCNDGEGESFEGTPGGGVHTEVEDVLTSFSPDTTNLEALSGRGLQDRSVSLRDVPGAKDDEGKANRGDEEEFVQDVEDSVSHPDSVGQSLDIQVRCILKLTHTHGNNTFADLLCALKNEPSVQDGWERGRYSWTQMRSAVTLYNLSRMRRVALSCTCLSPLDKMLTMRRTRSAGHPLLWLVQMPHHAGQRQVVDPLLSKVTPRLSTLSRVRAILPVLNLPKLLLRFSKTSGCTGRSW